MTSSKQTILESIRSHTTEQFACPDLTALEASAVSYPDPVAQFKASLAAAGGRAIELAPGQSVGQLVALLYPQATRVANTVANLSGAEALPGQSFNPDTIEQPGQLNGTDVAIIASGLGVAENACCWIADTVRHRAIYFIAEALVIESAMKFDAGNYDIAVIGAGHAGIEAGLACARLGLRTAVFTINLDAVGNMP